MGDASPAWGVYEGAGPLVGARAKHLSATSNTHPLRHTTTLLDLTLCRLARSEARSYQAAQNGLRQGRKEFRPRGVLISTLRGLRD